MMPTDSPVLSLRTTRIDQLQIQVHHSRRTLGIAAAHAAAESIRHALANNQRARVLFACAPSQNELIDELVRQPNINWAQVVGFHMDEYVGLAAAHPASFRHYLQQHLRSRITLKCIHELEGDAKHTRDECKRYTQLLKEHPIDVAFLGIGENGHLAFNDPPWADFSDPETVKQVKLDEVCRQQQVNDGSFARLSEVPKFALTLTIPTLLNARQIFCVVPGSRKAAAVHQALRGPVSTACPASVLRKHPAATLYLDIDSSALAQL